MSERDGLVWAGAIDAPLYQRVVADSDYQRLRRIEAAAKAVVALYGNWDFDDALEKLSAALEER